MNCCHLTPNIHQLIASLYRVPEFVITLTMLQSSSTLVAFLWLEVDLVCLPLKAGILTAQSNKQVQQFLQA